MIVIDLEKRIERGSWRWLGLRVAGYCSSDIPVAGCNIRTLARKCNGRPFRIGRIDPQKAFVIEAPPFRLLYVHPRYTGYRYAARKVFAAVPWKVDYDHALGKQIATSLGFSYVLLLRVNPSVNRGHGRFERPLQTAGFNFEKLGFADQRILDKWLNRPPLARRKSGSLKSFDVLQCEHYHLTLKQAGQWAYACGVEDDARPLDGLTALWPER